MPGGDTVVLTIEDIAFGGKGVGRNAGKAVFVPFTIEGEKVTARITRDKKQFSEAEFVDLLSPSPHRVVPQCRYFGECGGCTYQHIAYQHQLELKTRQVEQALRRIGRLTNPPVRSIIPSPKQYGYRNRITVHAEEDIIGFYRRNIHTLMDIESCPIAEAEVNNALAQLRARRVHDGHFTLRAQAGARVFAQVNVEVAEALVELVGSMLPENKGLLVDAFCGAGFLTKRFAHQFDKVIGIDWDRFAIETAQKNAGPNEAYLGGDVLTELPEVLQEAGPGSTTLIVDPPATGLSTGIRRLLLQFLPRTVIYVSCSPPTLARDLAELGQGFEVTSITPLDMFPQTAEIEVVAHLQSKQSNQT